MAKTVHLGDGVYLAQEPDGLSIAVNDHRLKCVYLDQEIFLKLVEHGTQMLAARIETDFPFEVHQAVNRGAK